MAFRHGRFAEISVNAVALSTYCDAADLDVKIATADTTTFTAAWETAISGLAGATFTINGNYDPTVTTGPAAVLTSIVQNDSVACFLEPGGSATGQRKAAFNAILTDYKESSKTTDKVTFSASFKVTGAVTWTTL